MRMRLLVALVATTALVAVGCGDDDTTTDSGTDTGPACTATCTAQGAACNGDSLVICAYDMDGCLQESMVDCTADGNTCDGSLTVPACVPAAPDPCEGAPECTVGRTCDGDTVVDCSMVGACLAETSTDCAAMGGTCDAGACVLAPDPCSLLPNACDAEGQTCDGDNLTICSENAFGCLVETVVDCTSATGGACDAGSSMCTSTDACPASDCTEAGETCGGPVLTVCAEDAFGCLVETVTDCTTILNGVCDPDAEMCDTLPSDPCEGVSECGTEDACDGDSACSRDNNGCYVATDCAATDEVCDLGTGAALCTDPCALVELCDAADSCDEADLVHCEEDANGCLVEDSRITCGSGMCDAATAMCTDPCPAAEATVINCATGMTTVTIGAGPGMVTTYPGCSSFSDRDGAEKIYRFENANLAEVEMVVEGDTTDPAIFLSDAFPATNPFLCDGATCDQSDTFDPIDVAFDSMPGEARWFYIDANDELTASETWTLTVTCVEPTCGDGMVERLEACDDGNTVDGDGCSADCSALEVGFTCEEDAAGMTVCVEACGNGFVDAGEDCDDGNDDDDDGCSMCMATCGDGMRVGVESCDDGNTTAGDGCSATCSSELAASGAMLTFMGDFDTSGLSWDNRRGCSSTTMGPTDHPYFIHPISNPTAADVNVTVSATWTTDPDVDSDGYLYAFVPSFDAGMPIMNCIAFDDDNDPDGAGPLGNVDGSELTVTIPAGSEAVVVASSYAGSDDSFGTTASGMYSITVATE